MPGRRMIGLKSGRPSNMPTLPPSKAFQPTLDSAARGPPSVFGMTLAQILVRPAAGSSDDHDHVRDKPEDGVNRVKSLFFLVTPRANSSDSTRFKLLSHRWPTDSIQLEDRKCPKFTTSRCHFDRDIRGGSWQLQQLLRFSRERGQRGGCESKP